MGRIGKLQIEFLVEQGLKPHHRFLDVGCGTLRGGRHLIAYLDRANYVGMDISPKAIEIAKQLIREEGLTEKNPSILLNEEKTLTFANFSDAKFDFILAQSVFTHLPAELIQECMGHIVKIMHDQSVFFFTYIDGGVPERLNLKTFRYPPSFFESLADQNGFRLRDFSREYHHARRQNMLDISRN